MITFLRGEVQNLSDLPPHIVLLTGGGVGYLISLPVYVYENLQHQNVAPGDIAEFHIYYSVSERQPMPVLVGFQHLEDRSFFEQFIQVEGIGPAKAASALVMPVSTIARAIETEDTGTLQAMPGIGSRAAQKIVATLKGKVAAAAMTRDDISGTDGVRPLEPTAREQVIDVLTTLGYRSSDAIAYVDEAIRRNPDLADQDQQLLQDVLRSRPTATATAAR